MTAAVETSERLNSSQEAQVFCGWCTVPARSVHALRPDPHRDLLLKARVYRVLSADTCGRGNLTPTPEDYFKEYFRRRP